jgi:ATP-dependent DNA helicase RecG
MPTYDLSDPSRVKVTLFGRILDKNYTQLLYRNDNLDLHTVFMLDKIQKHETISKEDAKTLKKRGLVEGRYPNLIVSYKIANIVGKEPEYILDAGLEYEMNKQLIIKALKTMHEARVSELTKVLDAGLPAYLVGSKRSRKVSNILQRMKREGLIDVRGTSHNARWFLNQDKPK